MRILVLCFMMGGLCFIHANFDLFSKFVICWIYLQKYMWYMVALNAWLDVAHPCLFMFLWCRDITSIPH